MRPRLALAVAGLLGLTLLAGIALAAFGRATVETESPQPLTVLAASSLTEVLPELVFESRLSYGGSNQLALQIREGFPADVFLSASPRYTQELYEAGLVEEPVAFATNSLVLVVPAGNPAGLEAVGDVRDADLRLVVAGPDVPVGAYTREALGRLGLLGALDRVVSVEPDVKAIVGKVALGEADAGFVYATDAAAAGDRVRAIELPLRAQPTVRYEAAVVASSTRAADARAWIEELLAEPAQRVLGEAGFGRP